MASDLQRSPLTGNFLADIASHTPDAAMRAHCPLPRRSSRDVLSALVAPGGVPLYSVALQGVALDAKLPGRLLHFFRDVGMHVDVNAAAIHSLAGLVGGTRCPISPRSPPYLLVSLLVSPHISPISRDGEEYRPPCIPTHSCVHSAAFRCVPLRFRCVPLCA